MNGDFRNRRWGIAVLALLAAVAIGGVAYQAGVSHGLALHPPVAVAPPAAGGTSAGQPPYPYYPYRAYGPWRGGWLFGPLLFLVFWIFVFRAILWGGFGGRRRWSRNPDYWSDRFDDWHRRAHDRMRSDSASPPAAS